MNGAENFGIDLTDTLRPVGMIRATSPSVSTKVHCLTHPEAAEFSDLDLECALLSHRITRAFQVRGVLDELGSLDLALYNSILAKDYVAFIGEEATTLMTPGRFRNFVFHFLPQQNKTSPELFPKLRVLGALLNASIPSPSGKNATSEERTPVEEHPIVAARAVLEDAIRRYRFDEMHSMRMISNQGLVFDLNCVLIRELVEFYRYFTINNDDHLQQLPSNCTTLAGFLRTILADRYRGMEEAFCRDLNELKALIRARNRAQTALQAEVIQNSGSSNQVQANEVIKPEEKGVDEEEPYEFIEEDNEEGGEESGDEEEPYEFEETGDDESVGDDQSSMGLLPAQYIPYLERDISSLLSLAENDSPVRIDYMQFLGENPEATILDFINVLGTRYTDNRKLLSIKVNAIAYALSCLLSDNGEVLRVSRSNRGAVSLVKDGDQSESAPM